MSDWIEREAHKIEDAQAAQKRALELRELQANTRTSAAPEIFRNLIEAIKNDIEAFNKRFPENEKRLKPLEMQGYDKFQVLRQYEPTYTLEVRLDVLAPAIHYRVSIPNRSGSGVYEPVKDTFKFMIQQSGDVVMMYGAQPITVLKASEMLLIFAIPGYVP
jgi:hypothetical protein